MQAEIARLSSRAVGQGHALSLSPTPKRALSILLLLLFLLVLVYTHLPIHFFKGAHGVAKAGRRSRCCLPTYSLWPGGGGGGSEGATVARRMSPQVLPKAAALPFRNYGATLYAGLNFAASASINWVRLK